MEVPQHQIINAKKQLILYQSYEYKLTQQIIGQPSTEVQPVLAQKHASLRPKMIQKIGIYMFKLLDTGGQPEFADFLPAISSSSYFIDICFSCGLVCLDQLNTINNATVMKFILNYYTNLQL